MRRGGVVFRSLPKFGRRRVNAERGRLNLQRSDIAIERLSRFRLFSPNDYRTWHKDIGAMPPAKHFIGYGADERRKAATPVHIARILGGLSNDALPAAETIGPEPAARRLTVGIYVSSLGNTFLREIAEGLQDLLKSAGHTVIEGDENSEIEARPEHCIYVAPHEFFLLGRGREWVRDDVLASACMYCTERATTVSFWESLPIVLMANSVVDMSLPLASLFSEAMPAACIFPGVSKTPRPMSPDLLDHPLLRGQRWWTTGVEGEAGGERPLDVSFFGTKSSRRARFLARNADRLSSYETMIYLRTKNALEPMNVSTGEDGLMDVARYAACHARVLLNVHQDEFPYFEWHRLVYHGMANSSVVVSEPCFANPEFEPNVHYLGEESHHLMQLVEWVLNDRDGGEKADAVAGAALRAVHDPNSEAARARALVAILTA